MVVVANRGRHRIFVGVDRDWWWNYPFPGTAFVKMDRYETNRCYQRLVHIRKFVVGIIRTIEKGDIFQ
jgi:hypothetical protein